MKAAQTRSIAALTRRSLLSGAAALVLGACASKDNDGSALGGSAGSSQTPVSHSESYNAFALFLASYPQMAQYPDESAFTASDGNFDTDEFEEAYDTWQEDRQSQRVLLEKQPDATTALATFFTTNLSLLMPEGDDEFANRVCSPLNAWLALALLSQITGETSQQQILDVLGTQDATTTCELAKAAWQATYCDDGAVKSILANSVWLSDELTYKQDALDTLSQQLFASSFSGTMGSSEYDQALQAWLDNQTGGLLDQEAASITMDPLTVIELASTIWYKARWSSEFSKNETTSDTFYAPNGDVSVDFMHASLETNYYWGNGFAAINLSLLESGAMLLVLPDEDIEATELLSNTELLSLALSTTSQNFPNVKDLMVNLAMPKFDVSAQVDFTNVLSTLGITDLLDTATADFSPLLAHDDDVCLSSATHAARVKVDEEGVEAAAFTVMGVAGASMPPEEEVDFVLDRPFMFAIANESGLLLFAGIVNQPSA